MGPNVKCEQKVSPPREIKTTDGFSEVALDFLVRHGRTGQGSRLTFPLGPNHVLVRPTFSVGRTST